MTTRKNTTTTTGKGWVKKSGGNLRPPPLGSWFL